MMESFAVRIEIDTPLSLRGLLHLDGLLGALAVAEALTYGRRDPRCDGRFSRHERAHPCACAVLC
jgi:hypothetical protein